MKVGEGLAGIAKTAAGFALGGLALNIGGDIVGQFKEVLTGAVELGRGVRRLQLDVGGSAESISSLLAVFHRFGVDGADAEKTLSLFSRGLRGDVSATDASMQNTKSFAGTLAELGVSATDAQGHLRPMNTALLEVADGFKAHVDDGQNAARAMALFGRSGRDLVPVLVLGRDGIMELEAEAQKLGLTLTQDNVNSVRAFVKEQKNMGEAVEGLKIQLGTALMPLFLDLAKATADWAKSMNADGGIAIKEFSANVKDAADWATRLMALMNSLPHTGSQDPDKGKRDAANKASFEAGANDPNNPGSKAWTALQISRAKEAGQAIADVKDAMLRPQGTVIQMDQNGIAGIGVNPAVLAQVQAEREAAGAAAAQDLARQRTTGQDARSARAEAQAAQLAQSNASQADATLKEQQKKLDDQIMAGEREKAVLEHDITLKTRESLDLKKTEAELQLQLLPLKAQQADIDQQLLIMADKRAGLERDAAVIRAQMAGQSSADALEGANFEERRLKLKIQADALAGRGVSGGDVAALTKIAMSKPGLELADLMGNRGATMAERDRTRAQQAQDLATIPLREQKAALDDQAASLSAQSAAVQRQIEEARLHGAVDTTDLQKQKQALDDALFAAQQKKADMADKGVVLNIQQTITATGEVDYDKVLQVTYQAVLDGLRGAQNNGAPAPAFTPGSRGGGQTGEF